jgi:hypothetical protein
MATLKEYFETDFSRTLLSATGSVTWRHGTDTGQAPARVHFDFDSNARFLSCLLPIGACHQDVLDGLVDEVPALLTIGDGLEIQNALPGELPMSSRDLRFAGRVFVYHEREIGAEIKAAVCARARERDLLLQLRGPAFAEGRARLERPLAFISHDSGLARLACPVWFDEFSLPVGARLRESIERGLREARKCILVLTPNFMANTGWTREEFDAIFTRELVDGTDVILPVWGGVTRQQVFEFSPTIANRVAVDWRVGELEAIRRLRHAVGD